MVELAIDSSSQHSGHRRAAEPAYAAELAPRLTRAPEAFFRAGVPFITLAFVTTLEVWIEDCRVRAITTSMVSC
jgi:hypothetical protein